MAKMQMRCGQCGFRIVFDKTDLGEPAECEQCGNLIRLTDQTAKEPSGPPRQQMAPQQVVYVERQRAMIRTAHASPVFVGIASFILLGLGQMVIGQVVKGLVILGVGFLVFTGIALAAGPEGLPVVVLFGFAGQLIFAIDAILNAIKLKKGTPISSWESGFTS
jgi:TM2 domain-containing membrane protein YozV